MPVPPNDQYNFFFANSDCNKYVSTGFVPQLNYTAQECQAFIHHINENYVISGWYVLLICFMLPIAFCLVCVLICIACSYRDKLRAYMSGVNG